MRLGIVGTGRVGASFVLALQDCSAVTITGILNRTWDKSVACARQYGVTPYADGVELVRQCDVLLLTVPDDALGKVSAQLAQSLQAQGRTASAVVLHCSGAMDLTPLLPLRDVGCAIGSLHPLQSFARPDGAQLRQIYMALDGDERAQLAARKLAAAVGSTPFQVPAAERATYHAAACFASNFVVTAAALGQALLSRWTGSPEAAAQALAPLVQGTAHNLLRQTDFGQALTGPIARGDVGTVRKHLASLPTAYQQAYRQFALATADVAVQNHFISREQYEQFRVILTIGKGDSHEPESQHIHDC